MAESFISTIENDPELAIAERDNILFKKILL
jgi:hypothetical protein